MAATTSGWIAGWRRSNCSAAADGARFSKPCRRSANEGGPAHPHQVKTPRAGKRAARRHRCISRAALRSCDARDRDRNRRDQRPVNDSESPLAWLARHKGRDGCAMISPNQFIAGEKLRADFTRGHLSPRVTSDWSAPTAGRSRTSGSGAGEMTDLVVASRQRVRLAMEACGPEFSGLLMDVCCFLRGLEEVE